LRRRMISTKSLMRWTLRWGVFSARQSQQLNGVQDQ
jgi:hypothetical protein